ncbi:hypothetical protein XI04_32790 [Bradyrhizobium sp. CCBAU 11430]|nr:hypothetical protein [Bradyrhizobium sp. CCBAU 11430]
MVARSCVAFRGAGVSHFLSMLLLTAAVILTVCFGVAAWRLSDGKDVDITGQTSRQFDGWKGSPTR